MKDYVKCCYCEFIGLVELGSLSCPRCKREGFLSWVDENNQEVEDDYIIKKGGIILC